MEKESDTINNNDYVQDKTMNYWQLMDYMKEQFSWMKLCVS